MKILDTTKPQSTLRLHRFYLVPEDGLEPSRSKATDFESVMYTNFTTRADAAHYTYTRFT
jgi:hypothetical protein